MGASRTMGGFFIVLGQDRPGWDGTEGEGRDPDTKDAAGYEIHIFA